MALARQAIGGLLLAIVMTPALAAGTTTPRWQSVDALQAIAERTVRAAAPDDGRRRTYEAHPLDPRLRLPACADAPRATLHNPGQRRQLTRTVAIECDAPGHWTLYVRVTVGVYGEVLVARRPLVRGHRIGPDDLYRDERRVDQLPYGWFETDTDLVGRPLRRGVAAGNVITPAAVGVAHEIRKGQEVLLKARTGGVEVGMAGEALEDGSRGDHIRVRNLSSGTVVEGLVRNPKVVEILLD